MVKVLIKKLESTVKLPEYKTIGSSGMDLVAFIKKPIKVKPKTSSLVPTGLAVAFYEDYEIQIRPRSGLAVKNNISVLNTPGTIDSDYRGELGVLLINLGDSPFIVKHGKRIAQLIIAPYSKVKIKIVNQISKTFRNTAGFGSTGNS